MYSEHTTLFTTCYHSIPPSEFSKEYVLQVWKVLKKSHAIGIAHHGGIKKGNCMYDPTRKQVILLDWGYARPLATATESIFPSNVRFQGPTWITSSDAIIDSLSDHPDTPLIVYPADEAISLIYLALHARFPDCNALKTSPTEVDDVIYRRAVMWDNLSQSVPIIAGRRRRKKILSG